MTLRKMLARDPHEAHRPATPLELFFDLCFVVAIAQVAAKLHHGLSEGHVTEAIPGYLTVFLAIWWAWMGFTWFASAYDTNDTPYRLKVFLQMAGVLVLAAGVPRAFDHGDFSLVVLGYVIMRIGLVALWLRAARANPQTRPASLRYAGGIIVLQAGWIGLLWAPVPFLAGWGVLVLLELLLPIWAERAAPSTWHAHHIAERYGLFTIIVLGEAVLAATLAIQAVLESGSLDAGLVRGIVGGLVILFSMWWLYFEVPSHKLLGSFTQAFVWGYGHLLIFTSAAAVGSGLAVYADFATHHSHLDATGATLALAVPLAIYVLAVWALLLRPSIPDNTVSAAFPLGAALLLVGTQSPWPLVTLAAIMAALVGLLVVARMRGACRV